MFHPMKMKTTALWMLLLTSLLAVLHAEGLYRDKQDYLNIIEKKNLFTFDLDKDKNDFPDSWMLEKRMGFEDYHAILIDHSTGFSDSESLRFTYYGGGKSGVHTGPIRLSPRFAYNISMMLKGQNLSSAMQHKLRLGLRAYDSRQNLLMEKEMVIESFMPTWTSSGVLRIETLPEATDTCSLYVHLKGLPAGQSYLWIDDVRIDETPRVAISTTQALNTYPLDEDILYSQSIQGTHPDRSYNLITTVTDFIGTTIDSSSQSFSGTDESLIIKRKVPQPLGIAGVFYIHSRLESGSEVLVETNQIVARNDIHTRSDLDPSFGVILGKPRPPFNDLITSLNLLGISMSKLDFLPADFSFTRYSTSEGLTDLNDLLLEKAPDRGFRFIATLNSIPSESFSHTQFEVNPAEHIIETFPTHKDQWIALLESLLFKYGNVINGWQIGGDAVPIPASRLGPAKDVLDFLRTKANWTSILIPSSWSEALPVDTPNLYIPSELSLGEITELFKDRKKGTIFLTLQLDSLEENRPVTIVENLIKKITYIKSLYNDAGEPLVKKIFFDRLTDEQRGLMTPEYHPHTSYFATRTLVSWFQDSVFLGQLTLADRGIQSYVFQQGKRDFIILWRDMG
ncbi:MAG: hypothetical protein HQL31_01130, partial [Planctomycetes bacterium]|nr:hypothetical protein [Planctomycetota bacterium]